MTGHVDGLIKAGLPAGDADLVGHVFWSALHGSITLQLAGKLAPEIDPHQLRLATFRALVRGFGPRPD
jgi:hypothetical protein